MVISQEPLDVRSPSPDQFQLPVGEETALPQRIVAADDVVQDGALAPAKRQAGETPRDLLVPQVAEDLVPEIMEKVVRVSLLEHVGGVEDDAGPEFPEAPLRDEAAPDVRHPERAEAGKVQEGIRFRPPPGALAVEGAPRPRREPDGWPPAESERAFHDQAPDCVDVGGAVCKPLLDGSIDLR